MATGAVIFRGKIDYHNYAVNEDITVVFPQGVYGGQTALLYWQWTVNAAGVSKDNVNYDGIIDNMKIEKDQPKVLGISSGGYYRFDGELSTDGKTLKLMMTSIKGGKPSVLTLSKVYPS